VLALSHIFCRCYSLVLNVEKHVIAVIAVVIADVIAVVVVVVIAAVIAVVIAVVIAAVIAVVFLLVVRTDSWCCMFLLAAFSNCPKGMTDATHVVTHSFQICDAIYITSHKYV
jgi:hypothetical protein